MDDPQDRVHAKTALGREELQSPARRLTGVARTALILCDGRMTVRALSAQVGPTAGAIVDALCESGHLVRVEVAKPKPKEPPPPPPPAPTPSVADDLAPRRRTVLLRLAPHFGPDVAVVAQPLMAARTRAEFEAALDGIERKLAIYVGRGQAAKLLADVRGP